MNQNIEIVEMAIPGGAISIHSDGTFITKINFIKKAKKTQTSCRILDIAAKQIHEFFQGKRVSFDLPYMAYGSEFQQLVWEEMEQIPFGQTLTYGEIAERIKRPNAARAVGMACNKNPLPIIIPCHRVMGAGRKLTGFAGGIEVKKALLDHEGMTEYKL